VLAARQLFPTLTDTYNKNDLLTEGGFMAVNLVAGETVHADLKGYAFTAGSANEAISLMQIAKEGCISPWYSVFGMFDTCSDIEGTRKKLAEVLKYVDNRLPQMPKSPAGLHIFNPNTPKVILDGCAQVRLQMEVEGFNDENDLHGNTPNVIQNFRDHFIGVMATQMENAKGIIYEAITASQELYCNLK
jgi:hypothetical protein